MQMQSTTPAVVQPELVQPVVTAQPVLAQAVSPGGDTPVTKPTMTPQMSVAKFCASCGAPVEGKKFCTGCGARQGVAAGAAAACGSCPPSEKNGGKMIC